MHRATYCLYVRKQPFLVCQLLDHWLIFLPYVLRIYWTSPTVDITSINLMNIRISMVMMVFTANMSFSKMLKWKKPCVSSLPALGTKKQPIASLVLLLNPQKPPCVSQSTQSGSYHAKGRSRLKSAEDPSSYWNGRCTGICNVEMILHGGDTESARLGEEVAITETVELLRQSMVENRDLIVNWVGQLRKVYSWETAEAKGEPERFKCRSRRGRQLSGSYSCICCIE